MTSNFPFTPALWSYGLACSIFVAFAALMVVSWRGGARAALLLGAIAFSALWSALIWASLTFPASALWQAAGFADALRISSWLIFLTLLLEGWQRTDNVKFATKRTVRYFAAPAALLLASALLVPPPPWENISELTGQLGDYYVLLAISVFGLALTEQLYQRTPENRRWAIKPLVIGLGGMFALDLLIYSGAILLHRLDPAMWAARGIADALVIFLVGVSTARNTSWTVDVQISRDVVYQSTALLITGAYLLVVAGAAYWVHFFGGEWGGTLQVALVFAALLGLAALLLSRELRARVRVLISKNLFSYRYEYRQEWLRFTRVLGTTEPGINLYQRVVRSLADLVESNGGAIWLERDGVFSEVANVDMQRIQETESSTGSLASFLARTDWVIRLEEVSEYPAKYPELVIPAWLDQLPGAWLVVPLPSGNDLIGFVVLARPRAEIDINWEVRDLLKTASRQAASYLAQIRAKEALVEAEQFDAFNRMSAFVVHDLKNLVAQLALVVKNAERHRDNPEFQRDMLETVEHAVGRMNQLMLQLRTGTTPMEKPRPVDLGVIIGRIIASKGPRQSIIDLDAQPNVRVLAHDDRVERVIGHMIQNAIEATETTNGHVRVRIYIEGSWAVVAIADDGVGMTEDFIRDHLFHPFQTSKPQGMGIGMYESIQYINGIGGRIEVESSPNAGTRFDVFLQLAGTSLPANRDQNRARETA
ncbi:MAG: XrtA/PEP-CTERM system histidine kinase PrsK [Betaproteobacteria bacterium]